MRIGQGFDAHAFMGGRPLRLGGVEIPYLRGLAGHSDGDVLLHAVANAILGALGDGDLGRHFPSADERWRDVDSGVIVRRVAEKMRAANFDLVNVDATIVAEAPRLEPHVDPMRAALAELLDVPAGHVNVKVTSSDGLGAVGRGEGIAAMAVVLLRTSAEAVSEGDGSTGLI